MQFMKINNRLAHVNLSKEKQDKTLRIIFQFFFSLSNILISKKKEEKRDCMLPNCIGTNIVAITVAKFSVIYDGKERRNVKEF